MPLLIHTGGTIGMAPAEGGLIPRAGLVEAAAGRRARVLAFDPLVDSAAVGPAEWNRLLDLIETEAGPVVITHGTDTMSYTGAALSQALAGWPHPVVLTGAMRPLGTGGDAEANLELALSSRPGPGVWLAFAGRLMPAGALVKHDSSGADAFRVVPAPPHAGPFRGLRFADRRVGILTIAPGTTGAMIAAALAALDGAVLRVFGAGTIPPHPSVAYALEGAIRRGCRLRAVSVCETGGLAQGAYAAGASLWAAGVENGGFETAEAALIRLWLSLSER
ncbi:asparaginase domain-containing protein [Mesorhizobium sp. VK23B]|uniref:Asparaginase domain-containing protein n=1 Tax=Mesorhizobium dulcispinae TaxID=3072316 RepID=A0ABU4XCX9_9HYPH|nr:MULTISPECIES: asparaginase domain-containing protein [unclassified Mesorhizobium]MDX8465726.1 asparaginase domain-containing protein [Mesorhizobium sp. VK23B]MDX8471472.1 asparaginase domain-containing protein [Mesorhizobium sp. VK23A]